MALSDNLNLFPRPLVHLVRELNRQGYSVCSVKGERAMSSNDIKGLAAVITDEITKLRDRARAAGDELRTNAGAAHEVISHVETMNKTLKSAVDDLMSALGQHTNTPPGEN